MTNVGEWSKKEACWERIRQISISCTDQIEQWIVSKEDFKKVKADGKKLGRQDDGIALQKTVFDLTTGGYWAALLKWPQTANLLLPADRSLVLKASTVQGFQKIHIEKEWRKLMEIKQLCEEEGFRKG